MHVRSLTVLTAIAAVTLVIAGCDEAIVEAKVPAKVSSKPVKRAPDRPAPPPQLVELMRDGVTMPGPPQAVPSSGLSCTASS